ncbi:MAG: hypothetical protein L0H93_13680, partial [Nocardioides sp.]|nr:hypothetical protein [Nocardioides sp.]
MVRYFPGNRRRMVAVSAAFMVAITASTAPYASADDDLKDKKHKVEKKIDHAHEDLDESSAALRRATTRLRSAQAKLAGARGELAQTRGQLTVARVKDRKMQAELAAAAAALARAPADLREGRQKVREQGRAVGNRVADVYENGDPQLRSLSSILDAQDPNDVTRSLAATDAVVEEETGELDDFKAAEVLLAVDEENIADKRDAVEDKREEAAENLEVMRRLERQALSQARSVRKLVTAAGTARGAAAKVRSRDKK